MTATAVEPKPKLQIPIEDVYAEPKGIQAAHFVNSVPFIDERQSCSIGLNCDSILPARLEVDGSAVVIDKGQRADGLVIRRKFHNRGLNTRSIAQVFVPWANIRGVQYL